MQGQCRKENEPSATGHNFAIAPVNQRFTSSDVSPAFIVCAHLCIYTFRLQHNFSSTDGRERLCSVGGYFEEGLGQDVMVLHGPLYVARGRADGRLTKGGVAHTQHAKLGGQATQ